MKTKNIIAALAFILILIAGSLKAQTVYVTESGKKYHAKNCSIIKTGKKGIDLAEAKKQGFEPCKSCKSEEEPKAADKPKEKKAEDKPKK